MLTSFIPAVENLLLCALIIKFTLVIESLIQLLYDQVLKSQMLRIQSSGSKSTIFIHKNILFPETFCNLQNRRALGVELNSLNLKHHVNI